MALTKDQWHKSRQNNLATPVPYPVAASVTIFAGAIVAIDASGNLIPAPAAQNAECVGIAQDGYVNGASITTTKPVTVCRGQQQHLLLSTTPTQADVTKPVYYVDDASVTLSAPADVTTQVGRITELGESGNYVWVDTSLDWQND